MNRAALISAALLLAATAGAQEASYERDAQGRIAAVTTAGGTTRYRYFGDGAIESVERPDGTKETYAEELVPAGQAAPSDAVAGKNRFLFTGHMWDVETGLYYAKARYYDPETGRFTTQDTYLGELADPPSLHRYMYAHDNPARFIDPTGHSDKDANRLAAAMHKRTGFLAADHRRPSERSWWYNFRHEVSIDLPPRLLPMGQFEGLANQDAGQFAMGTAEVVVAAVTPPVAKKGVATAVKRFPKLGMGVGEATSAAARRLRAPKPTAPVPEPPANATGAVNLTEATGRDGAFVMSEDGLVPQANARGGVSRYETGSYGELKSRSLRGDGLDVDHQPSKAALLKAAEAAKGAPLTPAEAKAIVDGGSSVAVPEAVHRAGPTYGGKNTPARIRQDAADLPAAAARDADAMVQNAAEADKAAAEAAAGTIKKQHQP